MSYTWYVYHLFYTRYIIYNIYIYIIYIPWYILYIYIYNIYIYPLGFFTRAITQHQQQQQQQQKCHVASLRSTSYYFTPKEMCESEIRNLRPRRQASVKGLPAEL